MDEKKFLLNGKTYVSVPDETDPEDGCAGCVFDSDIDLCNASPECLGADRKDGIDVTFREA